MCLDVYCVTWMKVNCVTDFGITAGFLFTEEETCLEMYSAFCISLTTYYLPSEILLINFFSFLV